MTKDGLVGRELKGKTVGVVGTGAIGSRVAELCHLFGCEIAAYDLFPKKNAPEYLHYGTPGRGAFKIRYCDTALSFNRGFQKSDQSGQNCTDEKRERF